MSQESSPYLQKLVTNTDPCSSCRTLLRHTGNKDALETKPSVVIWRAHSLPLWMQRPLSPLSTKERGQSLASPEPRMRGHGNHINLLRSWEKGTETSLQGYPKVTRGTETPQQDCPR